MSFARLILAALALGLSAPPAAAFVRIKDIVHVRGVRENQLVGYGLVVGLQGSGDSLRNSPFTEQSTQSMLDRMGIAIKSGALRTRNVAAVIVTAELPAFIGRGARIDVTVSSLGDASSLMGGTLVMTPLTGVDGATYAVAQGPIAVSGFVAQGQAERLTQGVPTAGRVPGGGLIEREVPASFGAAGPLVLELRNPDFNTVIQIVDAINGFAARRYGRPIARERDNRAVEIARPAGVSAARFVAEIGVLTVTPQTPSRVVIDARTGTVVIGQDVRISPVAITQGNLTVRVTETPVVSQPQPLSRGQTVVTPLTSVSAEQQGGHFAVLEGPDLRALVRGLNCIGINAAGIISILQAIKTAGALQADLVIQ